MDKELTKWSWTIDFYGWILIEEFVIKEVQKTKENV